MTALLSAPRTRHADAGYLATILADSPLGVWPLSEASGSTAADQSGNGRDGTYNPANTGLGQTGLVLGGGTSYRADVSNSTNNFAEIASASWMNVAAYTCELWFKTSSTGGFLMVRDFSARFYQIKTSSGKLSFIAFNAAGSNTEILSPASVADGNIHHACCTYDGTNMEMFLDGASVQTGTRTGGALTTGTEVLDFGARHSSGGGSNDAIIGWGAFYGAVLSSARIAAHYAAGH